MARKQPHSATQRLCVKSLALSSGMPPSFACLTLRLFVAQAHRRVRLLLTVSEAWLGCGGSGSKEKAAQYAQRGLDLANEHGLGTSAAHMQIGRQATALKPCHFNISLAKR